MLILFPVFKSSTALSSQSSLKDLFMLFSFGISCLTQGTKKSLPPVLS
jgi:hypothetical protein